GLETNLATVVFAGFSFAQDPISGAETMTSEAVAEPILQHLGCAENGLLQGSPSQGLGSWRNLGTTQPPVISLGAVITQPQHGTLLSIDSSGDFVYEPDPGFVGLDCFTY